MQPVDCPQVSDGDRILLGIVQAIFFYILVNSIVADGKPTRVWDLWEDLFVG